MSMATAQATEVADLKQKLELADEDIILITRHKVYVGAACLCMYTSMSTRLKIIYCDMHNCRWCCRG